MKILAENIVCSRLFQEAQDAQSTVMQLLEWQLNDLDTLDISGYKDILQAITNVESFFGDQNPHFNEVTKGIIKKIMSRLQAELNRPVDPENFVELLHINQSLLSAIDGKKELSDAYKMLPFSELIRVVLARHLGK